MTMQSLNVGSVPNDGKGDPLRVGFIKIAQNFSEVYGRVANAADFGAVADGATSFTAALNAAVAASVNVLIVDQAAVPYIMNTSFSFPSNFRLVAGKGLPVIKWNSASSSRMLFFSGVSNSGMYGIGIDGNNALAPTDATIIINSSSSQITIRDCSLSNLSGNASGGLVMSGGANRCLIATNQIDNAEGTAIAITSGFDNIVQGNQIRTCPGGWGVGIEGVSYNNLVAGNDMQNTGGEAIVVQSGSYHNRIVDNHCTNTGDNGISISGYGNVVSGNLCIDNANAGIGIWGSENTVTGNIIKNSNYTANASYWAGIWVQSNYGGTGSFNTITGNTFDDDKVTPTMNYAIRLHGSGYFSWAQGQVISNLSDYTQLYRVNGLNIYAAQNTGTTGSTPPTHTSGAVSDGGVTWLYLKSFTTAVGTLWNHVSDNGINRYKTAPYYDADNWQHNVLFSSTTTSLTITADGAVRARPL